MTVGSPECDIDDNKIQKKCHNNNNNRENKNKTLNTFSSSTTETNHLKISANKIPTPTQNTRMGRRKQNCPQKTGVESVLDPTTQTSSANDAGEENGTDQ